ncbi:hypothetical protein AB6813_05845 [bacterium RCC_150]
MKFDPGTMASSTKPHISELFTDRESESNVLKTALKAHRRRIDDDSVDMTVRHNVLVYYGVGGVGKSTLSQRLDDWINGRLPLMNGWGREPSTKVDAAVRIDLRDLGGQFDAIGAVMAIRRELGALKKLWPAFDFAFAAYWEAAHPGEPLPGHGRPDNGFGDAVVETLERVFSDLGVLGSVVGVGSKSARAVIGELQRRRLRRLAFESYDGYRDLLERCSELPSRSEPRLDLVVELAGLLSMELSDWGSTPPLVVVFVDTVERLTLDSRRIGEKLLNQLVWNMPHLLFVMTGRNLLDWFDGRRTNLHKAGRSTWPGLVPGAATEPRQHLVGKLSPRDTRKVIHLGREKYQVPISDRVVEELVAASGGLPIYLDLALAVALNVKSDGGREVTVDDVTGSLDELVMRVLEDIPADEQRAIRAASMFLRFDVRLIAVAANVDYGTAERAMRRPMVDSTGNDGYAYRLHDEIRTAIRWSGHRVAGGWAIEDWREAGTRALREARRRFEEAAAGGRGEDCLAAVGLAICIMADQDVDVEPSDSQHYTDWLSKAIVHGPSVAGLRKYVRAAARTAYGQFVLDFISAKTYEVPAEQRRALLRRVFDSDHPLGLPAGRHLAYQLRNSNRWDESLKVFEDLIARAPTELNRYQRLLTLANARRFTEAKDGMGELSVRKAGLQAHLELSHGRPELWLTRIQEVLDRTISEGRQRDRLEHLGTSVRWRTILVGDVELGEIAALGSEATAAGYETATRECLSSVALLAPGSIEDDPTALDRLEYLDRNANDGSQGFRTATVKALRAYVFHDRSTLLDIRDEIEQQPVRSRVWIPVECLLNGLNVPIRCPNAQWMEPYPDVEARWMEIFESYRSRVDVRAGR